MLFNPMLKKIFSLVFFTLPFIAFAQEEATTSSGKTVLLFPDSTWKLKPETVVADNTSADSLGITSDSVAVVVAQKPDAPKQFSESATGFKGFLKPELKISNLPEQSDGVYQFKVKVNKQGQVKEVVTLQRGPNGEAEIMMRNAIAKLKFLWDNSIVPPLTEGTIKIVVPAVK
jgi:hypothetical protein